MFSFLPYLVLVVDSYKVLQLSPPDAAFKMILISYLLFGLSSLHYIMPLCRDLSTLIYVYGDGQKERDCRILSSL